MAFGVAFGVATPGPPSGCTPGLKLNGHLSAHQKSLLWLRSVCCTCLYIQSNRGEIDMLLNMLSHYTPGQPLCKEWVNVRLSFSGIFRRQSDISSEERWFVQSTVLTTELFVTDLWHFAPGVVRWVGPFVLWWCCIDLFGLNPAEHLIPGEDITR